MPSRLLVAAAVAASALVLPGAAWAHGGPTAPVATDFAATIRGLEPESAAIEARAVDGDRSLWLHVDPGVTVVVPGAEGEPLLRFDGRGVSVNLRSLTAQSDRIAPLDLRPDVDPRARPLWHRLTSAHSYRWHEHRLHLLEPLARGRHRAAVLGPWMVPLLIDGHRHALVGVLRYRPPPSAWPWVLLVFALALASAGSLLGGAAPARRVTVAGALGAMLLTWLVYVARELYGRPTVSPGGYFDVGLTSVVGIAFLWGLLHRDEGVRVFVAFFAGVGAFWKGITLLPVFTHATALTVIPTPLVRVAVAAMLGLGAGALAIALQQRLGDAADGRRASDAPHRVPSTQVP